MRGEDSEACGARDMSIQPWSGALLSLLVTALASCGNPDPTSLDSRFTYVSDADEFSGTFTSAALAKERSNQSTDGSRKCVEHYLENGDLQVA